MTKKSPSRYLAEALVRAQTWHPATTEDHESSLPAGHAFTIAISREVGAKGTSVARAVGSRLGWPVYDQELLDEMDHELKVGGEMLQRVDERPGNWLEESVDAIVAKRSVNEPMYFRGLVKIMIALGTQGECVIVGRGAAHLLPEASTLRVRLQAYRHDRVAVMSQQLGISLDEAARYVDRTERERTRFIQNHYRKDPADPQHYDLVLNTSRFTVDDCANQIVQALHCLNRVTAVTVQHR